MHLILASASPRRRALLAELGIAAEVRPVELDEAVGRGEAPGDAALRLAVAKARALRPMPPAEAIVLAADTIVAIGGRSLGKPVDREDNQRMLASLSGRTHRVYTGVAVRCGASATERAEVAMTEVRFARLEEDEIAWYASLGEGLDKAGGYGIQGRAGLLIEGIAGSYTNVVGLPVELVYRLLRGLGIELDELS